MRTKRMASTVVLDPTLRIKPTKKNPPIFINNVVEEIEGLIRVYKEGKVERPQIVPCVEASFLSPEYQGVVNSRDIVIDKSKNIWARFYVPISVTSQLAHTRSNNNKLPLLVYFHGGGFCVGSAAWSCYHEFLSKLSSNLGCLIMSVNYRLAPENPLPTAYEDGFKSLNWLKQQAAPAAAMTTVKSHNSECYWWWRHCDFSRIFLIGDSAGANITQHLATSLASYNLTPLTFRGSVLLQPFFGGKARTNSERLVAQSPRSTLSLQASDTYWRLALPPGANRDHPWCNPSANSESLRHVLPVMVCVSEIDILRDRNLEFCAALSKAGKKVECKVYEGVGHAFQILSKSELSLMRSNQMMAHIKAFISRY